MPVDKFGHTDVGQSERVIAGGVTLSQVNANFFRLDGTNRAIGDLNMNGHGIKGLPTTMNVRPRGDEAISWARAINLITDFEDRPIGDNHLTNKKYVDEQVALNVLKSGDTMTGNLSLSVGSEQRRTLGCRDLRGNKEFTLYLGSASNKLHCRLNQPIILQSTDGYLCKKGDDNIMRIGKAVSDSRIDVFQHIVMNRKCITDLGEPLEGRDAATKTYVDRSLKKCHVGYIPCLEANDSVTGFLASSTSNTEGHEAYQAFNNNGDGALVSSDDVVSWLQIKCPDRVRIWRIAIRIDEPIWNLSASNDGVAFITLFTRNGSASSNNTLFFDILSATAYQYYRLTVAEGLRVLQTSIKIFQLYTYDT